MSAKMELQSMVMRFGTGELADLLANCGLKTQGDLNELRAHALSLIKYLGSPNCTSQQVQFVVSKIKQLYFLKMMRFQEVLKLTNGNCIANGKSANPNPFMQEKNSRKQFTAGGAGCKRIFANSQWYRIPLFPNIIPKELPFFDILYEIVCPTSLLLDDENEKSIQRMFYLTAQQASEIANSCFMNLETQKIRNEVEVQLRFFAIPLDGSGKGVEQDDCFPPKLLVKINQQVVPLPPFVNSSRLSDPPVRLPRPLYLTRFIRLAPSVHNQISVEWEPDEKNNYVMTINIVRRLSTEILFGRLNNPSNILPSQVTKQRIKELTSNEGDDVCAPVSLKVSVACPLVKTRMTYPCRGINCKHLQCFDAHSFLLMNEKKSNFICPVCNTKLKFNQLKIDGYFLDVINKLKCADDAGNEIELYPDGSCRPILVRGDGERKSEETGGAQGPNLSLERGNVGRNLKRIASEPTPMEEDHDNEIIILEEVDKTDITTKTSRPPSLSHQSETQDEIVLDGDTEEETETEVETDTDVEVIDID